MLSFTRNNGPGQQSVQLTQSPPAASQFNPNTFGNQQTGNAIGSMYVIAGVKPQNPMSQLCHYGADSNRQPSNWQTSAVHQAVYFQQTAGSDNYQQRSPANERSRNPILHHLLIHPSAPDVMLAKEVCPQQVNSANWNQSVGVYGKPSITTQNGNIMTDRHHCWDENSLLNLNGKSVIPASATATSPQHGAVAYNGTLGPAAAHHGPTAHNNSPKQNPTQHCFHPSYMSVSQSFRNDNKTTHSSPSGHNLQVSSTSRIFQQSSAHNNGGETAGCINSNNRQHETNFSVSQPNNYPLNPAAQQEIFRRQTIARIENYLRMPIAAGSDGRPQVNTSSAYGQNKNVQPVTTVAKIFNANATHAIRQNSRPPLPQTTCSVMSAQHCGDVLLQQSSVPSVINVSAMQDGSHCEMLSAKANDPCGLLSPGRTRVVAVVQPLSQGSYQVAGRQSSSCTASQLSEGATADGSSSYPDRLLISPQNKQLGYLKVGQSLLPENPNQMSSSQYEILHSAVSNNATCRLSSSDGPQHSPQKHSPQKQSPQKQSTVAAGSELDVDMQVHKCVAPTAQPSVTSKAPVSQNCDMDLSETTNGVEVPSVPQIPWTRVTLSKYIQDCEKAQIKLKDFATRSPLHKSLSMFWDGDISNLASELKKGLYHTLMDDVKKVCREHATIKSMSKVWGSWSAVTELKNYNVLKDTDVYKERPYKSLWLNVNEQLDDIDKEFDFPPSLKYHLHSVTSVGQPGEVEKEGNNSAQTVNEVSNKILSSTELQQVELNEEEQEPSVETTSTQTKKRKTTDSSDPYSFQIQVLTPEDAKVIFEQVIKAPPESMVVDMDYQPDKVLNSSVEVELPDVIDVTQSDPKLEDKTFGPIEEICCIDRWMENILGSNTASKCKCQIKPTLTPSQKELTAKTVDKEGMAAQKNDSFRPDNKSPSAAAGENQAESGKSVNNRVLTFDWPVIVDVFSENIDNPEGRDKPHSHSDQDPENIDQISIDSGQSSILFISDDEELSCIESETPNQIPNLGSNSEHAPVELRTSGQLNCSDAKETAKISRISKIHSDLDEEGLPYQLKHTGHLQLSTLVKSDQKIKSLSSGESDSSIQMTDLKENCGQTQARSTNDTESSLETEEIKSAAGARQNPRSGKLKRPRGPDRFLPASKKSKKCKSLVDLENSQPFRKDASNCGKVFFHASDGEPSPFSRPTVDLVLFGSRTQDNCVVMDSRRNHSSSPEAGSNPVPRPPKSLTVNLSPLKKKTIKTVQTWECSVQRLYKKWKISFPPAKIKHKGRLKAQKGTFAPSSKCNLERAEKTGPAGAEQPPVCSNKRVTRGKTKPSPSLLWRKSLSEELQCEEQIQTLNRPDDQERNNGDSGSHAVMPLRSNGTLKYSVLPVSFNFGSNGTKETKEPVSGKPDVAEGKDHRPNQTVIERSTWYPMAHTNSLFFPPTPKTTSLFQTFQKKYMEKVKPLEDK